MFSHRLPGVESLGQVSFISGVSPNAFSVDPETGFFIPNNQAEDGLRTYLGFIGLYGSDGGFNGLSEVTMACFIQLPS
ncbi:hypothetical protein IPL68_05250 [Candidatus Saccharibacteria bacterium]|nr:MAG: hypothetical protein IPL68_05250 [Candidatus Saccharibacteria bacterium]